LNPVGGNQLSEEVVLHTAGHYGAWVVRETASRGVTRLSPDRLIDGKTK
jgi:hypothetical protein